MIFIFSHTAVLSGGEIALVRLVAGLRESQHFLVVLGEEGPLRAALEDAGAKTIVVQMAQATKSLRRHDVKNPWVLLRALAASAVFLCRLFCTIRDLRPDVVQGNSLKASLMLAPISRLLRVPFVWHVRDRYATDYMSERLVRFLHVWMHFATQIVCNSHSTAKLLPKRLHARTQVIYDLYDAQPHHQPKQINEDCTLFVLVGRLAPWKGQDLAVRAFAKAFPDGKEELHLVGGNLFQEDDYLIKLKDLLVTLEVGNRVFIHGHLEDPYQVLRQADVSLHASIIPEPFGQVVLESLAAGIPTVASNAGGPLEILENGLHGVLFQVGSEASLSKALTKIAKDVELRRRLAASGLVRARAFASREVTPAWSSLYSRYK